MLSFTLAPPHAYHACLKNWEGKLVNRWRENENFVDEQKGCKVFALYASTEKNKKGTTTASGKNNYGLKVWEHKICNGVLAFSFWCHWRTRKQGIQFDARSLSLKVFFLSKMTSKLFPWNGKRVLSANKCTSTKNVFEIWVYSVFGSHMLSLPLFPLLLKRKINSRETSLIAHENPKLLYYHTTPYPSHFLDTEVALVISVPFFH